jgi:hypothetical protein
MMRKQCLRILIALIGVGGLGMAAKAQETDQIVVNIPYEFVAAGKTLPAGNYRVSRASHTNEEVLFLSSFENRTSVIIVSEEVESSHANRVQLSFEQVGEQHFLSKIETPEHIFTISVPRSELLEAAARSHSGGSGSGTSSGSN